MKKIFLAILISSTIIVNTAHSGGIKPGFGMCKTKKDYLRFTQELAIGNNAALEKMEEDGKCMLTTLTSKQSISVQLHSKYLDCVKIQLTMQDGRRMIMWTSPNAIKY